MQFLLIHLACQTARTNQSRASHPVAQLGPTIDDLADGPT
jgi:hypothetical protein